MKKAGFVLILLGIVLVALGIIGIEKTDGKKPVPYFILIFGLLFLFLGISFLFFELSYEKRKKHANKILITGLILSAIFVIAIKLKMPFVEIFGVCLSYYFSFTYLPLLTKNRIEKWKQFTRKKWHAVLLSIGDLISISTLILGYLFKKMHWPGASIMLILGIIILALSLIGWNRLFSKEIILRKQAEEKVNEAFDELKKQHKIIEEKNKEILDSLHYAKRIQQALLPTNKFIELRINKLQNNK